MIRMSDSNAEKLSFKPEITTTCPNRQGSCAERDRSCVYNHNCHRDPGQRFPLTKMAPRGKQHIFRSDNSMSMCLALTSDILVQTRRNGA
ncbi:uncharacterized protein LOC110443127 isoform X2 [Mizuhopecten yessoensis]|uniref:uncharacterized protein LOC110443127 isoform X2 n=1 Tax=Mizuhopecten yessoensis TaxID=6573 RepID=UPI000B45DF2A|nr:uncharacterized protein LOC110443127 isoform X2 [Mizuhopecten yessoensis]